jgi:hypothetical protein
MNRIAIFLLLSIVTIKTLEAQGFMVNNFEYLIISNTEPYTVGIRTGGIYKGDIIIPEQVIYDSITYSVTAIIGGAFSNEEDITSVTIPKSVTDIGELAFFNCNGLTSITIPKSVNTIGRGPFARCTNLSTINIESDNQYFCMLDGVLYNKNVTRLIQCPCTKDLAVIPNSVTEIVDFAFLSNPLIKSVTIPDSVISIGTEAFYNCKELTSVTLGKSVKTIDRGIFSACNKLTSVKLNDSLSYIGGEAFYGCISLTSITIPASVNYIDEEAFRDCTGLISIACLAIKPPSLGFTVFYDVPTTIPLYVPNESVDIYKVTEDWKDFITTSILTKTDIQKEIKLFLYPNPVNDNLTIEGIKNGAIILIYNELGTLVYSQLAQSERELLHLSALTSGMYIVKVDINGQIRTFKITRN